MHNIETVLTTSVELAVAMENHGAIAITGVQGPLLWVTCLTVQKPTIEQISLRVAATYSTKNLLVVVKDIEDAVPLAERWIEDNCTIITLSEYFTAHLNPTLKPTRDLLIANRFLRTDIGAGIRRELPEDTIYVDMGTTNFEELVRQWNSISNIIASDFNGYLGERKLLELSHGATIKRVHRSNKQYTLVEYLPHFSILYLYGENRYAEVTFRDRTFHFTDRHTLYAWITKTFAEEIISDISTL